MIRSISSKNLSWDQACYTWWTKSLGQRMVGFELKKDPALSQLTCWRQRAICSLCSVPFSHSAFNHCGAAKSFRLRFSATILRSLALAAFRSSSSAIRGPYWVEMFKAGSMENVQSKSRQFLEIERIHMSNDWCELLDEWAHALASNDPNHHLHFQDVRAHHYRVIPPLFWGPPHASASWTERSWTSISWNTKQSVDQNRRKWIYCKYSITKQIGTSIVFSITNRIIPIILQSLWQAHRLDWLGQLIGRLRRGRPRCLHSGWHLRNDTSNRVAPKR